MLDDYLHNQLVLLEQILAAVQETNALLETVLTAEDFCDADTGEGDSSYVEPVEVNKKTVAVKDKANVRIVKSYNQKGFPLMQILDETLPNGNKRHVQYAAPQKLEVYPNQIKGDGDNYYWMLVDNDGKRNWFVRAQDVTLLE